MTYIGVNFEIKYTCGIFQTVDSRAAEQEYHFYYWLRCCRPSLAGHTVCLVVDSFEHLWMAYGQPCYVPVSGSGNK